MTKPFHPFAGIFPLMEGAVFNELVADVKTNGLHEPIDVFEDMILDGCNRARACEAAGVDPVYRPFTGDATEALSFVVSKNLKRRHLNDSQRAMVAAKLANLSEGRPKETAQICAVSQDDAAARLNVSRRSVQHAAAVRDKGATDLQHAVEQGEVSVSAAAELSELTQDEQREVIGQGKKKVVAKAKQIRAKNKAARERKRKAQSPAVEPESQHDLDLRLLRGAWEAACSSAQQAFLAELGYPPDDTGKVVPLRGVA